MIKLEIKNYNRILRQDIKTEAAKISALLSGKTIKYEYLTGEKVLLTNQNQMTYYDKLTFRRSFGKTDSLVL